MRADFRLVIVRGGLCVLVPCARRSGPAAAQTGCHSDAAAAPQVRSILVPPVLCGAGVAESRFLVGRPRPRGRSCGTRRTRRITTATRQPFLFDSSVACLLRLLVAPVRSPHLLLFVSPICRPRVRASGSRRPAGWTSDRSTSPADAGFESGINNCLYRFMMSWFEDLLVRLFVRFHDLSVFIVLCLSHHGAVSES